MGTLFSSAYSGDGGETRAKSCVVSWENFFTRQENQFLVGGLVVICGVVPRTPATERKILPSYVASRHICPTLEP